MLRSLLVAGLAGLAVAACAGSPDGATVDTSDLEIKKLDCGLTPSFDDQALLELPGSWARVGAPHDDEIQTLWIGALQDVNGWAGKRADYLRSVTGIGAQAGSLTVIGDNPAMGAFLSFEDESGFPMDRDFYFVTGSKKDEAGKLVAVCIVKSGMMTPSFVLERTAER